MLSRLFFRQGLMYYVYVLAITVVNILVLALAPVRVFPIVSDAPGDSISSEDLH